MQAYLKRGTAMFACCTHGTACKLKHKTIIAERPAAPGMWGTSKFFEAVGSVDLFHAIL